MREKATVTVTALGPLTGYPTTALYKFGSCIYGYGKQLGISQWWNYRLHLKLARWYFRKGIR